MTVNIERIAEIRERMTAARELVRNGARIEDGALKVGLQLEDEKQLVEMWLQSVADCNSLLRILDGGTPI